MTGCRKQLPEVESRKEKVRGWGDGDLPFPPPPLNLPNLSLVPLAVALPCPCIWLLPQRVCGQQGLDVSLAPGCPGCSIPVPSPHGTGRGRDSAPQGAWSRGAALGVASPATSVLT